MKKIIVCIALFVVFAGILMGCSRIVTEEIVEVTVVVVEKDYRASYTTYTYVKVGQVTNMIPNRHPEKHYVTVEFEDMTETFEDEDLYDRVKEGESITVFLYRGYDENGVLVRKELRLEK